LRPKNCKTLFSVSVTLILIAITVGASFHAFNKPEVLRRFMMNPYLIRLDHQYERFITSGFLHKDHVHLLWNMFSFYFFGTAVEEAFGYLFGDWGPIFFLGFYLSAIVISDLPTYFKEKNNVHYNSLGASGGVGAVIFVFILLQPLQSICLYFALCMPGFVFGFGYMAYTYYQGRKANDNINHDAHLYGALYGMVFTIIVYPESVPQFYEQVTAWAAEALHF
jgi:membrane associated rhomboid family serine protease